MTVKYSGEGIRDNTDETKVMSFDVSGVTTNTTRTLTMPDRNVTIGDAGDLTGNLPAIDGSSLTNLPAGGKVLQVKELAYTSVVSSSSSAYTSLYSLSITPTSSTSKILIMANVGGIYMNLGGQANQTNWRISRNGGSCTGANAHFQTEVGRNETGAGSRAYISMNIIDEPATTASVTYAVQVARHTGTGSGIQINDTAGTSTIILMEVSA